MNSFVWDFLLAFMTFRHTVCLSLCPLSKFKILESKIESTLKKTLEIREEKIQGLESRLEESSSLNQQLRTELSTVRTYMPLSFTHTHSLLIILLHVLNLSHTNTFTLISTLLCNLFTYNPFYSHCCPLVLRWLGEEDSRGSATEAGGRGGPLPDPELHTAGCRSGPVQAWPEGEVGDGD